MRQPPGSAAPIRHRLPTLASLLLVLALLTATSQPAQAAALRVFASADTYVSSAARTTNYAATGQQTLLIAGGSRRALLRFAWPPAIPAGKVITGLQLQLYATAAASAARQDVYAITDPDSYDPRTVTWATQPPYTARKLGSSTRGVAARAYHPINLDVAAFPAPSGSGSVSLLVGGRNSTTATFHATETSGIGQDPRIQVTYGPAGCEGPITISSPQTISGRCFASTSPGTPAVTIATRSPVTLDNVEIHHAGTGIAETVGGVDLTVTNSLLQATDPGRDVKQRAIDLDGPDSLVAEHNDLVDGMGIWVGSGTSGMKAMSPLRVRYNDAVDIARFGDPDCCVQFFQADKISAAGDVSWNRVVNHFGRSNVEDNINLFKSSGTGTGTGVFSIHHNMLAGAYDERGNGAGYTGGGIMTGDNGGSYITVSDNRVVGASNYGVAIVGGHDNQLLRNRVINDGRTEDGTPHGPGYAVGIPLWRGPGSPATGPNTWAKDNVVGWEKPSGSRNDTWMPSCHPTNACTGKLTVSGDITAATEQAELTAWNAAVAAAGLTIGRP
jgi:hypothetical protein